MRQSRLIVSLSVLTALFATGYGVMFTVLDDFRNEYGIAAASLGVVVAAGFFAGFLAQVLLAPLADRGHARRLVIIGTLANIAGLVMMAIGESVVALMAARIIMGLGAGTALPAIRRIVILAEPEHLGTNVGRLLAADVAGFAVGPAISAVLVGPFGIAAPFLLIAVATTCFLPVLTRIDVDESAADTTTSARFAFDLVRIRPVAAGIFLGAALMFMIGTFDALWVLVLDDLGTADWIANLGIVLFAVPLVVLGPRGGRLAQRVGPFRLGTIGLLIGAGFMALYGFLPSGLAIFAVSMFHAVGDGFTVSSTPVAMGMVAPAERQAGAQGLLGGTGTLAGGFAALLAGWLYDQHGRGVAYGVAALVMVAMVGAARLIVGPAWSTREDPADHRAGAGEADAEGPARVSAP